MLLKSLICGSLTAVFLYCIAGLLSEQLRGDDKYVVILEWNLVFQGLAWLLTFTKDWKRVFVTLKGDFN